MVTTLTDEKRVAIAEKLADVKAIQNLLIQNEQRLLDECKDREVYGLIQDMIKDDKKNLGIIETTITQYGVQSDPQDKIQQMIGDAEQKLQSSDLNLYDKMIQHELLKHSQVVSGLVIHKAAQVVGSDVEDALTPLNAVNFENRAHQEQLKGVLEYLGTKELTGQAPDEGTWASVKDALAAMTGAVGSATTRVFGKSDMDIMDLIFMDHQKAMTLVRDIQKTTNTSKIEEYFGQLYKDLVVHSKAEEEVVYAVVKSFYGEDTQELYDEQAELETILNKMKEEDPKSEKFKHHILQVEEKLGDHTRQEESTMFAAMRKNFSPEKREQLATKFKAKKQELQAQQ